MVNPLDDEATSASFLPIETRNTGDAPILVFPIIFMTELGICRPESPCVFFRNHKIIANVPATRAIDPMVGKTEPPFETLSVC